MEEEEDELSQLKEELSESEKLLSELDNEITKLKIRNKYGDKNKTNYQIILKEKENLEKERKSNEKDIKDYKSQIIEIEKNLEIQKNEIDKLTKENEDLKNEFKYTNNPDVNIEPVKIRGVSDVRQSLGFHLKVFQNVDEKKEEKKEEIKEEIREEKEEYNTPGLNTESKKIEFEKLKKSKTDNEIIFYQLKEKINDYLNKTNEQKTYFENYRSYINTLNNKIGTFRQKLRISIVGHENLSSSELNVEQLIKDLESISSKTFKGNELISITKNKNIKKGENILHSIQNKLIGIDNKNNLTFNFLLNRINSIEKEINDLKLLCNTLEQNIQDIFTKKNEIELNIINFQGNFGDYIENYKENKKKIDDTLDIKRRKIIRKKSKRIFEDASKYINNEKNENNEEIYENIPEKGEEDIDILQASTLIRINDFGKNLDLFKSNNLFQNNNENDEKQMNKARLFKKNWNEVCYIYDDYDIHDVNYVLKAVGLGLYSYFNKCSNVFYIGKDIEILELEVNGKKTEYEYNNYCIDFDIMLNNLETAKIHLKYKEKLELNSLDPQVIEARKFYRQDYYGLSENLAGQNGKFRLILKGSFDIICFENDIFMRNENNKAEKEYIWGGKIPPEGKRTLIKFSKQNATWSFNFSTQIISKENLKNTSLRVPMGFIGGNNDIIKMNYSSPQTKDIQVDEDQRIYEIKYNNTNFSRGEFILNGEIRNRCKGEWEIDLSDEKIDKLMFSEDKKDIKQLEKIANKIIENFDKKNVNNIYKYMDYAKIGKWVYENIKYDLNYSGRNELTAMDIYNGKAGVCHHFTRLTNSLLYSIGYKVLYINGFACKTGSEFDQNSAHAWSLIKVGEKWFPFDSTWGIFSGKLPVCHIFKGFYNNEIDLNGSDGAVFENDNQENGKFIE